ncbi:type VI secretion system outer membrane lipoprotein TssJ [Syntrophotalea carbinolica DSM 2380]|uniref:Type VI secretion system outer membrane lipoprotein TssJ n=1 Tax=Syntrophotalea carbinolica (strain DSM 2380 / NBRC 103641 / GraBd1) TaxID=338963 RepID=Q3A0R4_SYNC1|nr:type VI secretion system lipoprotein TssJ [Syntrophotalea carbinolica]ABA90043.1 type VI secretion system outer membrane lipoprotein TssJ [Syntrophotalea carbinolica DSM 2380]
MPQFSFMRWFVTIPFCIMLCACSTPQVKMNLSSTANLNLNSAKEPLPVVVRIYQLSDPKVFENATFNELWKNDLAVLGNSLLRKDILTLDPASQQKFRFERHEQTRFVALMAAFNKQPNDSWRVVKKVNGSFLGIKVSTKIKAILKNNIIELED